LRGDDAIVGLPRVSVWIAARNLRGGDDVRLGDGSALGGFDLLALVMEALDGTVIESDRRLGAIDEQVIASDETHVVYEQRYVVDRVAELTQPTFDGAALAGADSLVQVVVGEVATEAAAFAFAGIDGEFRQQLGVRQRPIEWRGQLRASTDGALNAIECAIEAAVIEAGAHAMVDAWGRTFEDCVLVGLKRVGARRRHPVNGRAVQTFVMEFEQLNV
jgi:hypothetical protein